MSEERKKILEMLAIRQDHGRRGGAAHRRAGDRRAEGRRLTLANRKPRYLRVVVDDTEHRVNVRVPMKLIRAGIKLTALIPQQAADAAKEESGIDLSQINPENLDEIVDNLEDLTVDIDGKEKVRVFCE